VVRGEREKREKERTKGNRRGSGRGKKETEIGMKEGRRKEGRRERWGEMWGERGVGGGDRDGPKLALQVSGRAFLAEMASRNVAGLKHVHHIVAPRIDRARLVAVDPK
jgi:hypothetical protein